MRWLLRLADSARHRARLRRWAPDQAAGRRGEDLAHRFLERRGYVIVARNYRLAGGGGEIDLVGWDGPALAFIEVKSRRTEEHGAPDRNIDEEKQRRLCRAARDYARRAGVAWAQVRFDTVSVVFAEPPELTLVKDVFSAIRAESGAPRRTV
jgi:putative endonuclease